MARSIVELMELSPREAAELTELPRSKVPKRWLLVEPWHFPAGAGSGLDAVPGGGLLLWPEGRAAGPESLEDGCQVVAGSWAGVFCMTWNQKYSLG